MLNNNIHKLNVKIDNNFIGGSMSFFSILQINVLNLIIYRYKKYTCFYNHLDLHILVRKIK